MEEEGERRIQMEEEIEEKKRMQIEEGGLCGGPDEQHMGEGCGGWMGEQRQR